MVPKDTSASLKCPGWQSSLLLWGDVWFSAPGMTSLQEALVALAAEPMFRQFLLLFE